MIIQYICREHGCNNEICYHTWKYGKGHCYSCANKGKLAGNYKDGRTSKKYYCIDCKTEIRYRSTRCQPCSNIDKQGSVGNIGNRSHYKDGRCLNAYYCKCGKSITYQSAIYGRGNCKSCAQSIKMKGKMIGIKNPSYIHGQGYAPYPPEFNNSLKLQIRKQDNYECQLCHISEEDHKLKYNQTLHIRHIDYNKKNCEEENLISVCRQCNLHINFNREYWKSYFEQIKERLM